LSRLTGWQRLWIVLAALWIPGCIALLWNEYPRAEPWRQAFMNQRLRMAESDREVAQAFLARQCQTGDKYDLISPQRVAEYQKCMQGRKGEQEALIGRYIKAKAAAAEEAEQSVREKLPGAQGRVIAKGVALWLVPLISLYALGLALAWVRRGFRQ
jgi:hypothetical protein